MLKLIVSNIIACSLSKDEDDYQSSGNAPIIELGHDSRESWDVNDEGRGKEDAGEGESHGAVPSGKDHSTDLQTELCCIFCFEISEGCSKEEASLSTLTEFQLEHISSQQSKYDTQKYNIDWDEVKRGKAAGMPGGWVSTNTQRERERI